MKIPLKQLLWKSLLGVAKGGMLRLHYLDYGCVVLGIDDIPYFATPITRGDFE